MKTKSKASTRQPLPTENPRRRCHSPQAATFWQSPTSSADQRRARVVALIGSLHQDHLRWAELVIRMREETNLTYQDVAQLAEEPIAQIRQACIEAKRYRTQLLGLATIN
jgi:hypothetical protein